MLPVQGVEVRRWVILDEHPDHDAIEDADRRHRYRSPSLPTTVGADQTAEEDMRVRRDY
jgi:hypothetical protein